MVDMASEYLLHILECFMHGKKPEKYEGDMPKLIKLTAIHKLLAILGYMAMNYPDCFNEKQVLPLRKIAMKEIGYFANRAEFMKRLIGRMNEEGIDHLLFKGYVVKDYYPVAELRSFGDIDFLIKKSDRVKSDELMSLMGYKRKNDWEPVYSYYHDTEYYEIHTEMMEVDISDKADYKEYFSHTWERAVLKEKHTYVLSEEDHIVYLLTHIAKHLKGAGAGIRMYLDIAMVLEFPKGRLDIDYLMAELKKIKLYDFANVVFYIVEKYFDVKLPFELKADIDDAFVEEFMDRTMAGGMFGYETNDAGIDALKNASVNGNAASRLSVFFARLFPKASTIENRYTYIQNRHWLLPVAWVHRLFKTKKKWESHKLEAKSIMSADIGEVNSLREMYRKLGL